MTVGPRHIAALGGVFIAGLVALAGYDIYRNYDAAIVNTGHELDTQAKIIAEQTARSLQAVDVVLRHLVQNQGALARLKEPELHAQLADLAVGFGQIDGFAVIGPDGRLRAASYIEVGKAPEVSVADVATFQYLTTHRHEGVLVDSARLSSFDGRWLYPIARRLETPNGAFAGVVAARGRIDYFQDFYRDINMEPGTRTALVHRNGTLLARFPPAPDALGKPLAGTAAQLATRSPDGPPLRTRSPIDGSDRIGVVKPVPDYPLIVVVTRDAQAVLAPWRAQSLRTAGRTLGLAAIAVVLLVLLMRQFSKLYKTRESLETTRERYALAVAGSDDGIWDYDFATGSVFASTRARELSGLPPGPETLAASDWLDSLPIHPEDRPVWEAARAAHLDGKTPAYEGEWRMRQADGSYRWVRVHGLCIRDASGKPYRMAGSISDIDARKRAEDALRRSEERYALAVAGSDDGIWDYDFATRRIFASARARELNGLPPGPETQPMDEWLASLPLHPEDVPRRREAMEAHLAGKTPAYEGEFRLRQPDGVYRWRRIHGLCIRDAAGRPQRMAGSISDIDARKRAEEALRVSEERYALAVAGSDEGIWDYDFAAGKVFTSARARELLGLPPGGAETQPIGGWAEGLPIHPDDKSVWQAAREAHLAGETPAFQGEWRMRRPDGSYRWVRVHGLCVRDASGQPYRMAGSISDIDARKSAEEALRTSEQRYALAVAGSDDGIWDFDFVNRRVFASARARELSGLPPGPEVEPMDDWFRRIPIHPEDVPYRTTAMQAHLDGRTAAYEGEYRMRQTDGSYRWVRIHGLCVRDAGGKPLRMAGSISDIDARKRAEEALRTSEEHYRAIFNAAADALVLRDPEARVVDVNPAFLQISGYTRDEVISGTRWIFALPEMAELAREMHRRTIAGESVRFEMKARRKTGELIDVEMRAVPIRYRGQQHALGMARDITAQKRAQEALRASEEQYRAIFNAAADALVLRDAQANVVDVNPAFLQISGYSRDEVINQSWFFPPAQATELARSMHRRTIAGEPVHFEMQARRDDGELIDVEVSAVPIRYRGKPHALERARDVTAQKRAEAERARLEGQLLQAKKLEAIGTLAGGIAHDFNNILSAALGYGEMAQREAAAGTALKRHIDAVMSAGLRAKSLVERILAFSRSGMGERVPVHVESVVAEALDLVAASLPAHVRLERVLHANEATVMGDPTQIHQVVMNLCANGAQAMKTPGVLTVSLEVVDKPGSTVATSVLSGRRYVRLTVRDTGTGIAPNVLERIFDPFFTTKGVGVGTGLGLSLVHGIVTELGGGIDVESEPGKGAAFTVYLPWSEAIATPAATEQAIARGAGETILIVDDEEALVRLCEEMVARLGYEPVGFASSAAALEAFRANPERFHAVLSDESMPELTGCELARAVRTLRPGMPVVLMSGFVSPALAARARELGVAEVLSKPLVERDIARGLDTALHRAAKVAA